MAFFQVTKEEPFLGVKVVPHTWPLEYQQEDGLRSSCHDCEKQLRAGRLIYLLSTGATIILGTYDTV
jgi:hypothetical protein